MTSNRLNPLICYRYKDAFGRRIFTAFSILPEIFLIHNKFPDFCSQMHLMEPLHPDDIRILDLLQRNAQLNTKEIAAKIGKSSSAVHERIRKLEQQQYIKGYVALLDKRKIGKTLTAYTHVQLKEHAAAIMKKFESEVIQFPEVMECYHMTGQYDYLLKVELQDMEEYHDFMIQKLASLANVGTVQSFFVLKEAKKESAYVMQ